MAIFTATITYPDNKQIDLRDTLSTAFGYQDIIDEQPNPQNKSQFIQSKVNEFLYNWIKNTYKSEKERQQLISAQLGNDLGGSY